VPVRKFRSVGAMEDATWLEPGDPRLARAIALCWELAAKLCPLSFPPGVHKHRCIEALNAQRDAWEAAPLGRRSA